MARIEKTVFISYRRTNFPWALAISQNLTQHGYDVFFDYSGIASEDFESVILENIHSRAHFLVLLTPSALERCGDPADWLRREIEAALDSRRNIVPLMLEGFDFGIPSIAVQLTGKLAAVKKYNAMSIPPEYFAPAMDKLRDKFLNVSLDAVWHPELAIPAETLLHSCFISYSTRDQEFAERLNSDLRAKGLKVWFAPEELKIGDRFEERIEESIRMYDKTMIILSEASVRSRWVEREVNAAREREERENRTVLFPIRIDDEVMQAQQPWAAELRRQRHIGDFTKWKNYDAYQQAFSRLVRDLQATTNG